jgi:hypothetical protein
MNITSIKHSDKSICPWEQSSSTKASSTLRGVPYRTKTLATIYCVV